MSFTGEFPAIAARYGQEVVLLSDGEELGRGLAVLRPLLDREKQFLPTELGVWRREQVLCLGQASLPFGSRPGGVVLQAGEEAYDVVNARLVEIGRERIYWRAVLARREEERP